MDYDNLTLRVESKERWWHPFAIRIAFHACRMGLLDETKAAWWIANHGYYYVLICTPKDQSQ